jgi:mannosyltransferase OCH1-like enzyme
MPIPKIIHQTYRDYNLPETYLVCKNEIIKLHPGFEYRFYTDTDIDTFIKTDFPEYYKKFNELPRMIMKIDMFRYFLMYKYGGIYADMDYLMLKSFDLLNYNVVLPCNRENTDNTPACLGNCFFASEPNHLFWKTLMDTLFTINRLEIDYTKDNNIDSHVLGTGPMFVYEMWTHYIKKNINDIYIPKRSMFHPTTKNEKHYINQLKLNGCYGIHMCSGLWRNNKL